MEKKICDSHLESLLQGHDSKLKKALEKAKHITLESIFNGMTGILYYTIPMMIYETCPLAGNRSLAESVDIRTDAAWVSIPLYHTQVEFRKASYRILKINEKSSGIKKAIVDIASAYIFNTLVYYGILLKNGEKPGQGLLKAAGASAYVGLISWKYSSFQEYMKTKAELLRAGKKASSQ